VDQDLPRVALARPPGTLLHSNQPPVSSPLMLQCRRLYAIGLDARRLVVANCWNGPSVFPAVQWSRESVTSVTAKAITLTTID
jgi:hypothetical protein